MQLLHNFWPLKNQAPPCVAFSAFMAAAKRPRCLKEGCFVAVMLARWRCICNLLHDFRRPCCCMVSHQYYPCSNKFYMKSRCYQTFPILNHHNFEFVDIKRFHTHSNAQLVTLQSPFLKAMQNTFSQKIGVKQRFFKPIFRFFLFPYILVRA